MSIISKTTDTSVLEPEEDEVTTPPLVIKPREGKPSERSVLIIYTGGTLGMRHDDDGAAQKWWK